MDPESASERAVEMKRDCAPLPVGITLPGIIAATDLEFRLDDQPLGETWNLRANENPGTNGWIDRNWTTMLTERPLDRVVELEIHYAFITAVNGAKTHSPAGEYHKPIGDS